MGKRQSWPSVVALGLLAGCGSSAKPAEEPIVPAAAPEADVEAEQVQAIAKAVNEFGPAVHTCWARAAAEDFHVSGRVVLALDMLGSGSARASVTEDAVKRSILSECLVALWQDYQWPTSFVEGDRIELPPFEFVAPESQYVVALAHVPVRGDSDGVREQLLLTEANTGNAQGRMSLVSLSGGASVSLNDASSTSLLFVFSGTGLVQSSGKGKTVRAGSGVHVVPASPASIRQSGDEPLEFLRFSSANGVAGVKAARVPRVREVLESKALPILGGKGEVRILFDEATSGEAVANYIGALTAKANAIVPAHRHSHSTEYLFVLEGRVDMDIGGQRAQLQPGDAVQIPPGVLHRAEVIGDESFKAIQFYSPGGPEQRFKGESK
mgnify:CR=1 FL=1